MGFSLWLVLETLFAVILLVYLLPYIYRTIKRQWRIYISLKQLPCDPQQHWLMGHSLKLIKTMHSGDMLEYLSSMGKHGKIIGINMGPFFKFAMCGHPDTTKIGLGSDPKADIAYFPLMPWLGESLLTGSGKKWARTRRLLTSAFHFDILKPYVAVYSDCVQQLITVWKEQSDQVFDVFPSISLLTLDVMLRCTCSFESNCQNTKTHSPYVSAVYELSHLAMERILFFPAYYDWIYALMPSKRRFDKACNVVHKFSLDVIKKRRAALQEMKTKGQDILSVADDSGKKRKYLDFIDILLEARDEDDNGLSDEDIRAEVDTFMFEGHDTTASGIVWALYNLARYPEHQLKCREEVDAIFEEKEQITWDDLKKLTYLKYCIKESLRLFPPVPVVLRSLSEDRCFDGYTVAEGSWISISTYVVHHNPEVWEDPETFDPLRFTPENSKGRHPHALIAFSSGPRNCIGQEFALNEEKVVLAHILHNFEIHLPDNAKEPKKLFMIILRPKDGLHLKLIPRFQFD